MHPSLQTSCAPMANFVRSCCCVTISFIASTLSSDSGSAGSTRSVGLFDSIRGTIVSIVENTYGMNRSAPNPARASRSTSSTSRRVLAAMYWRLVSLNER
jgi:hypothetical protein